MNNNQAIMISYKTENRATADELFAMLEAVGLVPWMDYRGIEPGMKWRDKLIRQVRTCNAFVALLTPNYIQSEHCRMEILIARSRRCPILPIEVEECINLLDSYEETKGLADTFMVRLQRSSLVGLPISREQALERLVSAALSIDQTPAVKEAYIAYCNNESIGWARFCSNGWARFCSSGWARPGSTEVLAMAGSDALDAAMVATGIRRRGWRARSPS